MSTIYDDSYFETKVNYHMQKIIILLISGCILAFTYWAYVTKINEIEVADGKIRPLEKIHTINHEEAGTVEKLFVKEGDQVNKGDPLIAFRSEQIRSSLKKLEITLSTLEAREKYLNEEYEAQKTLLHEGINSRMAFNTIELQRIALRGDIEGTKETIKNMMYNTKQTQIMAPISGKVLKVNVTENSVVLPSDALMEIVPKNQKLEAEVKILPSDMAHIAVGQDVTLKITAYDSNIYGTISGRIEDISPFTLQNEDGSAYFRGVVSLKQYGLDADPEKYKILPGMTLAAEIKTGQKTIMQYLLKPFYDSAKSAFTEK